MWERTHATYVVHESDPCKQCLLVMYSRKFVQTVGCRVDISDDDEIGSGGFLDGQR